MSITIRPIEATDKTNWQDLFEAYLAFYHNSRTQDVIDTVFDRLLLDDAHEFSGFVACIDQQIVGFTHYLRHRKMWDVKPTLYLQDLFVTPAYRGQRVARALIDAVCHCAQQQHCSGVYWLTQSSNLQAQALYDKVAEKTDFIKYKIDL